MSTTDVGTRPIAAALALIHAGRVTTRAELTAALGVTRATVGAVLAELTALRLVDVSVPSAGADGTAQGLGRPSHRIGPAPDGPVAVVAQIHPDGFQVGLLGLGGALTAVTSGVMHDPSDPLTTISEVTTAAATVLRSSGRRCAGVGLAVPTAVTQPDGAAMGPLYIGWPAGTPLRSLLAGAVSRAGLPGDRVSVGNDINLAALAEHRRGAGRGARHLLVVASGQRGTGGAFVLDGRLYTGSTGLAMEAGHVTVAPDGLPCRCGNRGCLDVQTDPVRFLAETGHAPGSLDDAVAALRAGYPADPRVRAVADQFAEYLGIGLAGLINVLNPDRVLLGGLHGALADLLPGRLVAAVARRSPWGRGSGVPLLPTLLDASALVGAGEAAWQPVLDDPTVLSHD
jgi:predicted NBD/HSP70 family sugar kinase